MNKSIRSMFLAFVVLTEWLSGSGGTGETPTQLWHILAKRTCARAAEPLSAGAGVRPFAK